MSDVSIDSFLEDVRRHIQDASPESLEWFDNYANEACFGRRLLDAELKCLRPGDEVLEIGAGMLLLACQLKREGIAVTALEPVGDGFSHFYHLQKLIADYAAEHQLMPPLLAYPAEALTIENRFAFAYSLNVMEHVTDVRAVMERVYASLKPDGSYRFVCPNYAFPYEPHFALPTFGSKRFTSHILRRWIERSKVPDAANMWASLNWITVAKVKRIARSMQIATFFDRNIFPAYIHRMLDDQALQSRHSSMIRHLFRAMGALRMLRLIRLIPVNFLPVMDCRITRRTQP